MVRKVGGKDSGRSRGRVVQQFMVEGGGVNQQFMVQGGGVDSLWSEGGAD